MKSVDTELFERLWMDKNITLKEVSRQVGRAERTLRDTANRLGLPKVDRSQHAVESSRIRPYWTKERIEEFKDEYSKTDTRILMKKYGVSYGRIGKLANEFGILKERKKTKEIDWGIEDLPSYNELMTLSIEEQKILDKLLKQSEVNRFSIDTKLPIAVSYVADLHLGHPGVDYAGVDKVVDLICNTDGLYVYFGGDGSENFLSYMGAGMASGGLNQQQIVRQRALLIRMLQKLSDKIIAFGSSPEHTGWSRIITGVDDLADIAKRLNIIYTDVGGALELRVGEQVYFIFRTHRFKFQSTFNLTHASKQLWRLGKYDADIVIVEHKHNAAIEKFMGHGLERIAIRTGTAKIYDDYARKFGFYGQKFENPTVILFPEERRMIEFLHMEDAIITLNALRGE